MTSSNPSAGNSKFAFASICIVLYDLVDNLWIKSNCQEKTETTPDQKKIVVQKRSTKNRKTSDQKKIVVQKRKNTRSKKIVVQKTEKH